MIRFVSIVLIVLSACAAASGPDLSVQLEQLTPFSDFRFAGPVNVQYRITAVNNSDAPATLVRAELRTVGPAAYVLREPALPLHLTVAAKSSASVVVTARGAALGGQAQSREPVVVRATAYFDTPAGAFTRIVNVNVEPEY